MQREYIPKSKTLEPNFEGIRIRLYYFYPYYIIYFLTFLFHLNSAA